MKNIFLLASLLLLSVASSRAEDSAASTELVSPANKITLGQNDSAWRELSTALQANGAVAAPFTENRFLPFKKIPVVFTGDMRLTPERGLSLHYTAPEDRLMIVDAKGVLLRDDRGRSRELPSDPRAQAATAALLHVMRFDLAELSKNFDLYGVRSAEQWQIAFEPRGDTELAKTLSRLVVTGKGAAVQKIEMRRSALQRIEILVGKVQTHVEFSADELKSFFR